ncbi:uncharacterized protein DUF2628 [Mesorhizobium sp. J18]|uniref:DUF2628 domain-containing protein n=1 Tax=Mesorhizobium sp. J18 TaxID=935263 RepID=UPI00119B19BD|nr:DUF2628 domain-containing protein [Mesorhizobium sp. J18]TWG88969.1 uncharacterized protein DUF2628 [Mesorhizobium sp. J18]
MASYVVMERTGTGRSEAPETTIFVRDGFSFLAFLVPFFWFLWHRMWIEAAALLIVIVAFAGLRSFESVSNVAWAFSLLLSFLIGLEASTLRLWSLRRRGWRMWGVVEASGWKDAEARYAYERMEELEGRPTEPVSTRSVILPGAIRPAGGPALGLFDYPRTR